MQQVIDRIEAIVCELYYDVGDAKDRQRVSACHIVIASREKSVTVLRTMLG